MASEWKEKRWGVVASDVKEKETLEIRVAVDGSDHHLLRCDYSSECAWLSVRPLRSSICIAPDP